MDDSHKIVISTVFLVVVAVLFALPRMTFGAADNATINVTIQQFTEIRVSPTSFVWPAVNPGTAGGEQLMDIQNTGSVNVSQIYGYLTTLVNETSRPYGIDDPTLYAATGLITMRNETGGGRNFFAGRIEWNWTEDISNKDVSALTDPVSWGFVRNTSYEYFWSVGNGTTNCSSTDAQLGIESDEDDGTQDTRTADVSGIGFVTAVPGYGIFNVTRSSQTVLNDTCVAVDENCTYIYLYKYDRRSTPNFAACTNSAYIQAANLEPVDIHTVALDAYAPYGIPDGVLAQGSIIIIAT